MDFKAAASVYVMIMPKEMYEQQTQPILSYINVGYGSDISILELAKQWLLLLAIPGPFGSIPANPLVLNSKRWTAVD